MPFLCEFPVVYVLKGSWGWRECDPVLGMGGWLSGTANTALSLDQNLVQGRYSI